MGGSRAPKAPKPPKIEFSDNPYPGKEVMNIIKDAGKGIRDATDELDKRADKYDDRAQVNQTALGAIAVGDQGTFTRKVVTDPGKSKLLKSGNKFIKNIPKEDDKGPYDINEYNNYSDYSRMFKAYTGAFEGTGEKPRFASVGDVLSHMKDKGKIDDIDNVSLNSARKMHDILSEDVSKNATITVGKKTEKEKYNVGDDQSLTGRTMSNAMGDYRTNYEGTTEDMVAKGNDFIKNYESGLVKSRSFLQYRKQMARDGRMFEQQSDSDVAKAGRRIDRATKRGGELINRGMQQSNSMMQQAYQGSKNFINASATRANQDINTGFKRASALGRQSERQASTRMDQGFKQAKNTMTQGFNRAKNTMKQAETRGYNKMDAARDLAQRRMNQANRQVGTKVDTGFKNAKNQVTKATSAARTGFDTAYTTAKTDQQRGFRQGRTLFQDAGTDAYNTALYDTARGNFGTRADEGYTRYGDALSAVGTRGEQYSQNAALNMLRDQTYSTAAAAPPTLRATAAYQQAMRQLGGFQGGYGGMATAATRGNIRPNIQTTYDFGFGDRDAAGNYRRRFDRSTQTSTKAQTFYNTINNTNPFNFTPTRMDYGFTPGTNFYQRSGGAASRFYQPFRGGYQARG